MKTIDYVWRTTTSLRTGEVLRRDAYPLDVSSCCGADLMLWDEDAKAFADFTMLDRPPPPNAKFQPPRPRGESQ